MAGPDFRPTSPRAGGANDANGALAHPPASSPDDPAPRPAEREGRVIALTGAASFLGKNLVALLEEDPRVSSVLALDVKAPDTAGPKTRLCELDLTALGADERVARALEASKVDTLVHLAFVSSPVHAAGWAHELESVGTMHLLNGARRAGVRKLVAWSQTLLYGAHPTNPNFLTERHPFRADESEPYFADKIAAERETFAFAAKNRGAVVTVLRTAPILGPTVANYLTRYLSQRRVLTLLGFDPLWQFLHEVDAVAAFKLAIDSDFPGAFNIVGDGVLPLSTVLRLAGRPSMPIFHPLAEPAVSALWAAHLSPFPASFLRYLRYLCVADGEKAARTMGFRPAYTTREALLDFMSAARLRDANLLREADA